MRVVIIVAHPETNHERSHTRYGFEHARTILASTGVEHDVIDLYKDRFDPVMRREPTKRHLEQLERYRSLIDAADRLLILYPVWWNGPPAILKGFFDCILTPGWAYHYRTTSIPKIGLPIGHLIGKRAVIISTSGALNGLHLLVQHARAGRIIGHDILGFVGIRTRRFNIGGCQELDDSNRQRIRRVVERAVRSLGIRV